jgi:hypothetical protein
MGEAWRDGSVLQALQDLYDIPAPVDSSSIRGSKASPA